MDISLYTPQDRDRCIEIFKSNIPKFFLDEEVPLLLDYLDQHAHQNYWCLRVGGKIISIGGVWVEGETARLVWGIVDSAFHKQGYGRTLVEYRLKKLKEMGVKVVRMDTSQHNPDFFRKFGFVEIEVIPNKYGPGLHSHELELKL